MNRFALFYIIVVFGLLAPLSAKGQAVSAWNIGIGGTPTFMPTTDKTMKPTAFTLELGIEFRDNHLFSFDGGLWFDDEKTGEAEWYSYTYGNVIYWSLPTGVIPQSREKHTEDILRKYSQGYFAFSYHYVINLGEYCRLHLGPSIGAYYTKAVTDYKNSTEEKKGRPKIDNHNEIKANSFVYGIGAGISGGRRGYIDVRYRYLKSKSLEIEDKATKELFTTQGQIHQINIIIGLRWKFKREG